MGLPVPPPCSMENGILVGKLAHVELGQGGVALSASVPRAVVRAPGSAQCHVILSSGWPRLEF